jgi:L-fuculose-phosphate aldolase
MCAPAIRTQYADSTDFISSDACFICHRLTIATAMANHTEHVHPGTLQTPALQLGSAGLKARAELLDAIHTLQQRSPGEYFRSANASVLLPDMPGHILVTARGLVRDITENDFGVVTLEGKVVSGYLGPRVLSVAEMHTHAYRKPEVGAVFHTHSINATAFAVAQRPIPPHYEPLLKQGQAVEIPVTRYGDRNSGAMVHEIDALLADHPQTRAVLLANHGLLVFHENARKAADLVATIDEAAALFIRAAALGGSKPVPV